MIYWWTCRDWNETTLIFSWRCRIAPLQQHWSWYTCGEVWLLCVRGSWIRHSTNFSCLMCQKYRVWVSWARAELRWAQEMVLCFIGTVTATDAERMRAEIGYPPDMTRKDPIWELANKKLLFELNLRFGYLLLSHIRNISWESIVMVEGVDLL
jgi:hypothetical protein